MFTVFELQTVYKLVAKHSNVSDRYFREKNAFFFVHQVRLQLYFVCYPVGRF